MNSFEPEQIIATLNVSQLKSLLKLTDTPYTAKITKEDLQKIAKSKPEITSAIIINHLGLDKDALEKKLNKSPRTPKQSKRKKSDVEGPLVVLGESTSD
jgi:hypothetical protein